MKTKKKTDLAKLKEENKALRKQIVLLLEAYKAQMEAFNAEKRVWEHSQWLRDKADGINWAMGC